MKRIISLLTVIFVIIGVFSGCGGSTAGNESTAAATTAAVKESADTSSAAASAASDTAVVTTAAAASVFPLNVKDASGLDMTIGKEPVKIVSLTLGTDEMLLGDKTLPGLVDSSRVVSVTPYAVDPGVSNVAEAAKSIPNQFLSQDAEKIIALQPDLMFVDTWADQNFIKQMRDSGITVFVFKTPSNIDEQEAAIKEIAHVVGADERGGEIVSWMEDQLKAVEEKLKGLKDKDRLSMLDYSEMGTTSGKGTNTDDILNRAGLVNVAARAGLDGWPQINKEQVVEWNPDTILLPSWYYDKKNSLDGMKNMLKSDKSLSGVNAIKNNRMITVSYPHISAISQYVVLSVGDMARAAYPDLFK